mgnify:CR=1 FL=1
MTVTLLGYDDQWQVRDVEPACGDIGGDEHPRAAPLELEQGLVAAALVELAVQRDGAGAPLAQALRHGVGVQAGLAEHERALRPVVGEQAGDEPDPRDDSVGGRGLGALRLVDEGGGVIRWNADGGCTR